jgi:hypothetical protein
LEKAIQRFKDSKTVKIKLVETPENASTMSFGSPYVQKRKMEDNSLALNSAKMTLFGLFSHFLELIFR